jgi:SAM-dependent methyltransferase
MSQASPLATPLAWELVATEYVTELVPYFTRFAQDALRLAGVTAGTRVVDVAAGPGTLSFLAARAGATVSAIDFAPAMIAKLRERAEAERVTAIEAQIGDGMALPFADASFDAGFSMFGLMFFPDRARGFAEMHRVLAPGGRAVIASWVPFDRVPVLSAIFGSVMSQLPDAPRGSPSVPLSSPEACTSEMSLAGFHDVAVHEIAYPVEYPSIDTMWDSMVRSSAPIALVRKNVGEERWGRIAEAALASLRTRFGAGPQRGEMIAYLTFGRR